MELMREKILQNGRIAELKAALEDAIAAKEVYKGQIDQEEARMKNLFQTIKEHSSPVKGKGADSSTDISQQIIVLTQRDAKTGESIADDQSINQRSDIDNSIDKKPYKKVPPPIKGLQNSQKPPLNNSSMKHELDFLYKRVAEYQKAMDDIMRLPFINEAEVHDIIKKVYASVATKVSIRDLQKVNIYRIESPRRAAE